MMNRRLRGFARRRALGLVAFAACILIFAALAGVEHYASRDYVPYFSDHKGQLISVEERSDEVGDEHIVRELILRDDRGLVVRAVVKIPRAPSLPRAAIISLGGLQSGARALEYLRDTGDFVVLAMDFPFEGKRSGLSTLEFFRCLPAMRRALLDTPPATMLGVDYLRGLPEVDPNRVWLVGGSLGALVAPAIAATDERIAAVALLFGAGDLRSVVEANFPGPRLVRRPLAWIFSALVSPMEPLKYIGRIASRPVFMLNGSGDPRMPVHCSRLLHDAAGDPKTIRWIDAGHVSIRDVTFRERVLRHFREWLVETGYEPGGGTHTKD